MEESEKSVLPIAMEKVCRSCMNERTDMRSVFGELEIAGQQAQVSQILMACASVQVITGDGLPGSICQPCIHQLSSAYSFKQQCENSDTKLRQYANLEMSNIKEEQESEALNIVVKPDIDVMSEIMLEDNSPYDDSDAESNDKSEKIDSKLVPNQCKFCFKKLASKQGLSIHMRKHTGQNMKVCPICHAGFTKTNHLKRHLQQVHTKKESDNNTETKTHVCTVCNEKFSKVTHLIKHKRLHRLSKSNEKIDTDDKSFEQLVKSEIEIDRDENNDNIDDDKDSISNKKDIDYIQPGKVKGKFECKECHKILTTPNGLQIHMRRHTGHNLVLCCICNKSFTKTSHLKRHLATHGTPAEEVRAEMKPSKLSLPCEFCDRKFVYRKSFVHHMRVEHGISDDENIPLSSYVKTEKKEAENEDDQNMNAEGQVKSNDEAGSDHDEPYHEEIDEKTGDKKKVFECHVCQHKFTRSNHLTRHMTLHRNVLTHKCDRCEKSFLTDEHLQKHIQEYHIDRPYICTTCNKPFTRGEHLIRHLKVHDKEKKDDNTVVEHKCSVCDKVFIRSDHLARHTKLHLLKDKRHVCDVCNKSFNRLDNLRTHQRVHTGQRDPVRLHLCVYCGKEFNNSSNMIVHMRRHTGERPYKCNVCGKGFPRSHDLKCHERTHSGERPYQCALCGKSFNKSNKLVRHTRVHTGERPYVCNLCGRAFTQSNDLTLHMRRHTGSRPYACGVCPARFIQSGQLKAHRRAQGHWVEQEIQFRGNRVEPVHIEGFVETPIKHRNRVKPIKQEMNSVPEPFTENPFLAVSANGSAAAVVRTLVRTSRDDLDVKPTVEEAEEYQSTSTSFQQAGIVTSVAGSFATSENFNFQQYDSVI